jgi:hypothetical protein
MTEANKADKMNMSIRFHHFSFYDRELLYEQG